jgi:micrococcal nuclease
MFTYAVKEVVRVIDGDTVEILIDLGFSITIKQTVRIKGINSPEIHTRDNAEKTKGLASKVYAEQWFTQSGPLTVRTYKDEKYGRLLGEFFRGEENYSESAVRGGFAVVYDGGKR